MISSYFTVPCCKHLVFTQSSIFELIFCVTASISSGVEVDCKHATPKLFVAKFLLGYYKPP